MMEDVKVIVKHPGKDPEELVVPNELEAFRRLVGGYIETFPIASDMVALVNEEGRLRGMAPTMMIAGELLVGPVVLVGVNGTEFCDVPVGLDRLGFLFRKGVVQ